MVCAKVLTRGLHFIGTIIIARVLVPDDFGIVALAIALQAIVMTFSQVGIHLALIRDQNSKRIHYDSVWTFGLVRGAAMAALFAVIAPYAAEWFDEPRLRSVIFVFAGLSLIRPIENIGIVDFRKHMQFSKDIAFQFYTQTPNFIVTVTLAFILKSYWAIIIGMCAERVVAISLSYVLSDYRPRLSLAAWRELFDFSKWIMIGGIFTNLSNRSATFVIGKLTDSAALGLYTIAHRFSNLLVEQIVEPAVRPLLPGLAKLQDDRQEFERIFIDALSLLLFVAVPIGVVVACTAELLIEILFGRRWIMAADLLEVLALYTVIRAFLGGTFSAVIAIGKPEIVALLSVLRFIVLAPLLIWGVSIAGPYGAALALLATGILRLIANFVIITRVIGVQASRLFDMIWRTIASTAIMAGIIYNIRLPPIQESQIADTLFHFTLIAGVGALVYSSSHLLLWTMCRFPRGPEQRAMAFIREAAYRFSSWAKTQII